MFTKSLDRSRPTADSQWRGGLGGGGDGSGGTGGGGDGGGGSGGGGLGGGGVGAGGEGGGGLGGSGNLQMKKYSSLSPTPPVLVFHSARDVWVE